MKPFRLLVARHPLGGGMRVLFSVALSVFSTGLSKYVKHSGVPRGGVWGVQPPPPPPEIPKISVESSIA